MGSTSIEWTDATWNPVTGCTKVSPGCKNCYAERVFPRAYSGDRVPLVANGRDPDPARDGDFRRRQFTDVRCHSDRLKQPLHWRKPLKISVNSMSDLFHEDIPFEFIDKVFAVMAACPQHTFQVLTKRPERMLEYCKSMPLGLFGAFDRLAYEQGIKRHADDWKTDTPIRWPLPNVWLGVSVENQPYADERIPLLLQTPAAVRFVSYEPALSPVDFEPWLSADYAGNPKDEERRIWGSALDWIIVGGESGPAARPFDLGWARNVICQCRDAEVACFVKQIGSRFFPGESLDDLLKRCPTETKEWRFDGRAEGRVPLMPSRSDSKGRNTSGWPPELRVREFPR